MKLCTHILQQLTTDWPIPAAHQQPVPPPVVIKASAAAQDTKPDSAQLNEAWQLLHSRSLQDDPIVAIWLRGLCPRGVSIVLGAGLTITGYRRILGLVACYPENVSALTSFVQSLSDRGLSAADGLLCVLPSSTGLQSAVRQVFGARVAIQRCLNTLLDQVTAKVAIQRCLNSVVFRKTLFLCIAIASARHGMGSMPGKLNAHSPVFTRT